VSGTVARWVLLMAFLLAGCRSWFAVVRRVSFLLHKDRGQVPVVNGEEEASPPSYPSGCTPLGYVVCAQVRDIPQSCADLLAEPSLTEMS
jgi:hypothetical protein